MTNYLQPIKNIIKSASFDLFVVVITHGLPLLSVLCTKPTKQFISRKWHTYKMTVFIKKKIWQKLYLILLRYYFTLPPELPLYASIITRTVQNTNINEWVIYSTSFQSYVTWSRGNESHMSVKFNFDFSIPPICALKCSLLV